MFGNSKRTDVPETISDDQWAGIQRRAVEARRNDDPFGRETVARNLHYRDQFDKRDQN